MKIHRVFDDLGEFVAAFRGGISREAIRIDLDERHVPGTVLEVDLALADGLSLVSGRAAVVDVRQAPSHAVASWRTVLRFSSLDPDSRDFLERFERRQDAEGEPVLRPDLGPAPAAPVVADDAAPDLTNTGALEVAFRDMSRRPTVRERAAPVEERGDRQGGRVVRVAIWTALLAATAVASWFVVRAVAPDILAPDGGEASPNPAVVVAPSATPTAEPTPTATATAPEATPTAVSPSSSPARTRPRATGLAWTVDEGATVVRLTTDRTLDSSAVGSFRMNDDPGPRQLLVIRGVGASDLPVRQTVDSPHLAGIRTWLHDDRSPPELHVVLDLARPGVVADEPVVEGRTVTVRLR